MDLIVIQVLFITLIFISTIIASIVPIALVWRSLKKAKKAAKGPLSGPTSEEINFGLAEGNSTWFIAANSFACGIFVAVTILHLLPSSAMKWNKVVDSFKDQVAKMLPWNGFFTLSSFTFMVILKSVFRGQKHPNKETPSPSDKSSPRIDESEYVSLTAMSSNLDTSKDNLATTPLTDCDNPQRYLITGERISLQNNKTKAESKSLVVGVAMHNFLEGLTLGLQSNKSQASSIFVAVACHAALFTGAVSISLMKQKLSCSTLNPEKVLKMTGLTMIILCCVRPLGTAIGMGTLQIKGQAASVITGMLLSISTGVFINITFMSLCLEELSDIIFSQKWLRIGSFTGGWLTMVFIGALVHSGHYV